MNSRRPAMIAGFTLIELLTALLILSLLALMSYRGLGTVLDTREHLATETARLGQINAFFDRFERDIRLAAPRPVRTTTGIAPAWRGAPDRTDHLLLDFSRFAARDGLDVPRRVGYGLNDLQQVELWLWPGLDAAPGAPPTRHVVLASVASLQLDYLGADLAWRGTWPTAPTDAPLPRAVRLQLRLASGRELVRVFAIDA